MSSTTSYALAPVVRHTAIYCVVMGAGQGLPSLGGSLLRVTASHTTLTTHTLLLATVGRGAFALVTQTLYAALDQKRHHANLAGLLFLSGLLLLGKTALSH